MIVQVSLAVLARGRTAAAAAALAILTAFQCSGSAQKDSQDLGAIVLGAVGGCVLGGISFSAVTAACSYGTASGSGTLTANGPSGETISAELTFALGAGGSIHLLAGANPSANEGVVNRGMGVSISSGGTRPLGISGAGADVPELKGGVSTDTTLCLEIHVDEIFGHIMGRTGFCPTATEAASAQPLMKAGTVDLGGGTHGSNRGWGFVLSNATIRSMVPSDGRKFTE